MAINSKKKGSRNERNLSKVLKTWTGYEFTRTPQSGGLRWKKTDNISGDIVCADPDHSRLFPFSIETKFHDDINFSHLLNGNTKVEIMRFWKQTTDDAARAKKIPILLMRYNGMPADMYFAVVRNRFFQLINPFIDDKHGFLKSSRGFTIFNSYDLFNSDYKEIFEVSQNYLTGLNL